MPLPTVLGNVDYREVDTNIDLLSGTGLPGQTLFCTTLSAIDDNIAEGSEIFLAEISSLNGPFIAVNPARSSALVEILDDDSKLNCSSSTSFLKVNMDSV